METMYYAFRLKGSDTPLVFPINLISDDSLRLHRDAVRNDHPTDLVSGPFYADSATEAKYLLELAERVYDIHNHLEFHVG